MSDVAGSVLRGTVAAMAMSGMRELTISLGLVERTPPDEIAREGMPGLLAPIPPRYRSGAIELAHWGFGGGMGVACGLAPRGARRQWWFGPVFGLGVWAFFERIVAPLLGLRRPEDRPLRERAAVAADHVLYGVIVAGKPSDVSD